MPIPTPTKDETESDFISRCMADDVMNSEYPDNKQRAAVCYSAWRDKKMNSMIDKIVAAELAVDEQDIVVRFFKRGREIARKFFDTTRDAIHDAIAYVNECDEEDEPEAEVLVNGKVVRQFSAGRATRLAVSIPSGLRGKTLYDLDDREFQLGGFIDGMARKAGYSSGKSWANEHNAWDWPVEESVDFLTSQLSAESATLRVETKSGFAFRDDDGNFYKGSGAQIGKDAGKSVLWTTREAAAEFGKRIGKTGDVVKIEWIVSGNVVSDPRIIELEREVVREALAGRRDDTDEWLKNGKRWELWMEFPEGTCQEAADEGYDAGAAGKPSSANPYKHPALRQAWEDNRRQYHEDND